MSGPKLWVTGDWNAFFGFGINVLVNLLVLIGLLRAVLGVPETLILTRILPAVGVTMGLSCFYYAWLAWRLAQRTGRSDVCALPSGISVPHMFVVVTVVMLPVLRATGDFMQAWGAGLAWVFMQSFVLIGGGLIGPFLRRITPRAALLGSLTGVSLTFIAMGPAAQIFSAPLIGLPCLAILIASWLGKVRFPGGVPGGLVAMAAGTLVFWMVRASGLQIDGLGSVPPFPAALDFSPHLPAPALALLRGGLGHLDLILVTAIPFGLYDLVEGLDNVESAAAGGDSYPTVRVLAADGLVSLLGCLIGNPFINAVYIGHPGWKAMGGRIGYAAGTGAMVIALTCFGLVAGALAVVPTVAILPTLLYVGMLIGAQAFHESPRRHAPALVLALIPPIAAWGKGQIDMALAAAGTSAAAVGTAALGGNGVLYHGLAILGSGATLAGIILASIVAMVIDRRFLHAAGFALAGAVFTFCGVIHGEEVRLAASPQLAFGYALVAVILCLCARPNRADEIIGS